MDGARDDSVTIGHRWTRRVALGAIIIVMAATACTGSGSSNPTVRLDEFDAAPETNEPGTVTGSDSAPVANSGDTNSGDTLSGDTVASPSADPAAPTTTASTTTASASSSESPAPSGDGPFPLRIDPGSRVLSGADGEPFLVLGDAAWSLIVELTPAEVDQYLASRRDLGFNAVLVELIEHRFSSNPPFNRNGDGPFLVPGDFTTPNEAYFEHVDWVLQRLADEGFAVFLTPAYTGWIGGTDGWWEEMVVAGPDALREYGRFVGERYADFDNIVWVEGGDGNPTQPELVSAIAEGISESDPDALHTAHLDPDTAPRDFWQDADWLDIDNVYTYEPVYESARAAFDGSDMPFILMESAYENEHGVDTLQLRTQVFHALLTGATGHIFGNNPIWHFDGGGLFDAPVTWQDALDDPGSTSMAAIARFMHGIDWAATTPDTDGSLLTGGVGTEQDRAVAATGTDGSWAVVYVPSQRTITLDPSRLGGTTLELTWFDATTGAATLQNAIDVGEPVDLETPGANAAGDTDWILVVNVT